jgi:alpha-L-fucosidase 2
MTSGIATDAASASGLRTDVEYARVNGVSLRLDAFVPEGTGPFPAAIIIHGGGWVAGDRRTNVEPLFAPLAAGKFAWFSISYRLATDMTQFGVAIDDVQSAISFVHAHAAEFRVDPHRIALIGESAGGQLAAMAALRSNPGAVQAVVAIYAPTDLVSLAKSSAYVPSSIRDSIRGTPWENIVLSLLAGLSPLENVRRDMPPFLFIHGTADSLVPFSQSEAMCNRMKAAGASCELFPVAGAGHGIRWWDRSSVGSGYKRKMVEWLEKTLAPAAPLHAAS